MLRLGFNAVRLSSSIIHGVSRSIGATTVTITNSDNVNDQSVQERDDSTSLDQRDIQSELTSAAELKAMNNEGFFDSDIVLTGVAGKCMYNVDDENNVHAIRIPVRYNAKGYPKTIMAVAARSDLMTFVLNNVEEGVPVCVRGTFGRPALFRNFTVKAKHIQVLSTPIEDS